MSDDYIDPTDPDFANVPDQEPTTDDECPGGIMLYEPYVAEEITYYDSEIYTEEYDIIYTTDPVTQEELRSASIRYNAIRNFYRIYNYEGYRKCCTSKG
jgi:hypothetical protein